MKWEHSMKYNLYISSCIGGVAYVDGFIDVKVKAWLTKVAFQNSSKFLAEFFNFIFPCSNRVIVNFNAGPEGINMVYRDVKGCKWVRRDVKGCKWARRDVKGCKWARRDVKGCKWARRDVKGCKWARRDVKGCKWVRRDVKGCK